MNKDALLNKEFFSQFKTGEELFAFIHSITGKGGTIATGGANFNKNNNLNPYNSHHSLTKG
jgi:hypothetical protein